MTDDKAYLEKLREIIEKEAIKLMYMAHNSEKNFVMREGDSPLASLDRLLPDFYDIFTRNADLSHKPTWGLFEMFLFVGPFAFMFLLIFIILANRAAEIAIDQLVSLSVSCSHICQHGLQLSQSSSSVGLSGPLRMLRWLGGTESWVQKAWYLMRLSKTNTKDEMLRHLCSAVYRIREEKALLQKRRSLAKEGSSKEGAEAAAGSPSPVAKLMFSPKPAVSP